MTGERGIDPRLSHRIRGYRHGHLVRGLVRGGVGALRLPGFSTMSAAA
ncbi:hypothetical protein RMHFA_04549 (plasmid) [Roseomonas mucosa]|nr:hypothetical protein HVIM_04549 [Roseomonas mucosa]QDD97580.1 hypothetical protein ADP8_04549 [Roseomonas mucosa]UZO94428.1 hypothetical protein RMP42_04549 [Roseomonas mucosa]UZO99170.1 hypothetical protein RMHFA_04549 [Roseomonas mucosa]